jgi:hypothetical protein
VKRGANAGRGVFSADTSANIWPLKSPAWYLQQTISIFKIPIKLSFLYFLQYSYLYFSVCHTSLISHKTTLSEFYLFNGHDKICSMVNTSCDPTTHQDKVSSPKQATKAQRDSRDIALLFFNTGTGWEWVVNTTVPAALLPRKRPGTHCTASWVDPRDGQDSCKKSCPIRI